MTIAKISHFQILCSKQMRFTTKRRSDSSFGLLTTQILRRSLERLVRSKALENINIMNSTY